MIVLSSGMLFWIGKSLGRYLQTAYIYYQAHRNIGGWFSIAASSLKHELVHFSTPIIGKNTPWGLLVQQSGIHAWRYTFLFSVVIFGGLMVINLILQRVMEHLPGTKYMELAEQAHSLGKTNDNLLVKISKRFFKRFTLYAPLATLQMELISRSPYFITRPFYYLGLPANWAKFFLLVGLISIPELNEYLRMLLFVQAGITMSKDEVSALFTHFPGVFNFDSLNRSTELFVVSTFKLKNEATIKAWLIRITVLIPVIVKIIILTMLAEHLYEILGPV